MHIRARKYLLLVIITVFILFSCKKIETSVNNRGTGQDTATNTEPPQVDSRFYTLTDAGSDTLQKARILLAVNSKSEGELLILDQRGGLVQEQSLPLFAQNLQQWMVNGQIRYSYFQTSGNYVLAGLQTTQIGYEEICDSNLNVLNTVRFLQTGGVDTGDADKLDEHEFVLLGDNHYISEAYKVETPNNIPDSLHPAPGVKVVACIIQEINNGEVVFQWDPTQYPELYSSSLESNNFSDATSVHDYLHLNSICVDSSDNNLIVSFRNLDEIVKLNRQTGAIMWRLGGKESDFNLTSDEVFLRQHYPRLIENGKTLIILDNGLDSVRPYSRILEFQLNENAKTITSFKQFKIPDQFIQFAGSVRKEGDDYFIGAGAENYATEVNYVTGNEILRINLRYPSYRALKY